MKNTTTLSPVTSLADLEFRARTSGNYATLALRAANNLGGSVGISVVKAMAHLRREALETTEEGVVEEINFCRI